MKLLPLNGYCDQLVALFTRLVTRFAESNNDRIQFIWNVIVE